MKLHALKYTIICLRVYKTNILRFSYPQTLWHNRVTTVSSSTPLVREGRRQNCVIAWRGQSTLQNCLICRNLRFLDNWIMFNQMQFWYHGFWTVKLYNASQLFSGAMSLKVIILVVTTGHLLPCPIDFVSYFLRTLNITDEKQILIS